MKPNHTRDSNGWRVGLGRFVSAPAFQRAIVGLILINAAILGAETFPDISPRTRMVLVVIDQVILAVFVVELGLRLAAYGSEFFRDPWSVFDFVVVGIALVPATDSFAVIRALRVLRVLRLITAIPRLRLIVHGLLTAIPSIGAIAALLALLTYVSGVVATNLFGSAFPQWFGDLPKSLFSLFQIMTLESWSSGIARPVMEVFPMAWAFFVPFILITTFTMLNLFIAVIVSAIRSEQDIAAKQEADAAHAERRIILQQLKLLSDNMATLQRTIDRS